MYRENRKNTQNLEYDDKSLMKIKCFTKNELLCCIKSYYDDTLFSYVR